MPNAAFALLVFLAGSLAIAGPSSITRLLVASGPDSSLTDGGVSLRCMLVPTASDVPIHLLTYLLFAVAIVGVAAGASSLLSEHRRTQRLIRTLMGRRTPIPAALGHLIAGVGLGGHVDLVETREPLGFCFGLARPRVCLTTGLVAMLTHRELEAVLHHEAYHVGNRDPLRMLVGRALAAAFFFVPCCHDLLAHYRRHVEVIADRGAVRQMGEVDSLASALDKLLDAPGAGLSSLPGVNGGSLELRIDNLLGQPTTLSVRTMIPRLVLSAVGVLVIAAPAVLPLIIGNYPLLSALAVSPHLSC
jgi:Zn-dependent protease with chaperone function